MKTVQSSPILNAEAKSGLKKYWQGHILFDGSDYYLNSESWQDLKDGGTSKHNESVPYLVTIKNVGKANETTPLEQAQSEFDSMVKQQQDKKNYVEEGKKASKTKLPLPMLAQKYRDHSKKIVFPCYVQPKLDGNRMVSDGTKGQTRGGQPFIPEVIAHLMFDVNVILDGELILPDMPKLQVTMTAIKKFRPELSSTLVYWVYDIVDENMDFGDRYQALRNREHTFPPNVKLVETRSVKNEAELQKNHEEYVLAGYEGTIVRNSMGKYEIGHRSYDLQKKKDFQEEEFEVVGFKEGGGMYKGCAIFKCVTDKGEEFDSNPEGTIAYKKELFKNGDSYIGKWLTVRYFDKSLSGKPGFNVGVDFRDEGEF